MKRVLVVGADGDLGRFLCAVYQCGGWYVIALVAHAPQTDPIAADHLVEALIADPFSLEGVMTGVELVVSCLGVELRQEMPDDGQVDYLTTLRLLREAHRAGVQRFVHAHALGALNHATVLHALDLDNAGESQGPTNLIHTSPSEAAEAASANVHHLKFERKKL